MAKANTNNKDIKIEYVSVDLLKAAEYNPRKWDKEAEDQLKASIQKYGIVDPLLVNSAESRKNIVIGGHFRIACIKSLNIKEVPVVYINIPDIEREKELNIRLNKNTGSFDWNLLATFDESFLSQVGFSSEEIDNIFAVEDTPEQFDLNKELQKLNITKIEIQKGDLWQLGNHKMKCGDSTVTEDVLDLMGSDKADMCLTDPPYLLNYLKGKTKQKDGVTTGFGAKKNRRYLETDVLPDNFTELWLSLIHI